MFRSNKRRPSFGHVLVAGIAALALSAGQVAAQQPYIPPDAKGFKRTMIQSEYLRQQAARAEAAASLPVYAATTVGAAVGEQPAYHPVSLVVRLRPDLLVTRRGLAPAPVYVDIREPGGTLRSFPIEGGRAAIQTQPIVVHAGESAILHVSRPARQATSRPGR